MATNDWKGAFLSLSPQIFLKRLEQPFLYQVERDELYEIDEKALKFLSRCDGTRRGAELTSDDSFVSFCLEEGLLTLGTQSNPRPPIIGEAPKPSLRYLELQLLHQCNLRCRHCYLGPPRPGWLPLEEAVGITREFAARGGLRLMISGGEPLLYPELPAFLTQTQGLGLRRILLTNGTLLTPENARPLQVEEVQISLDGWRTGHEAIRGVGTFDQTLWVSGPPGKPDCPSPSPPWFTGRTWMNSNHWPVWWRKSGPLNGGWMCPAWQGLCGNIPICWSLTKKPFPS